MELARLGGGVEVVDDSLIVRPGRLRIVVGQALPTKGLSLEDRDRLRDRVREQMRKILLADFKEAREGLRLLGLH